MRYYKILNQQECHNGLQYKTGYNVDPLPFNPKGTCELGGIYFAREDILSFLFYGPWIREVTVPDDAQVYEDPSPYVKKWKVDKVVLGERREITAEVIAELLDEGATLSFSAMQWAIINSQYEVINLLLDRGFSVHYNDDSALDFAVKCKKLYAAEILIAAGAYPSEKHLFCACEENNVDMVDLLCKNGVDIHAGNDEALRIAAANGYIELVKWLLQHGANVHAGDCAALREAIFFRNKKVVKALVKSEPTFWARLEMRLKAFRWRKNAKR